MHRQNLADYISRRIVDELRKIGFGERTVSHPGGSTVVYQGHWIDLQDNGKQIIFLIERGPKFQYLYDGLEKYLQNAHIDSKDSLIVSSRSMSRQGGEVAITLNLSKINDKEKIYHAVYRVGMKPIMAALLRIS